MSEAYAQAAVRKGLWSSSRVGATASHPRDLRRRPLCCRTASANCKEAGRPAEGDTHRFSWLMSLPSVMLSLQGDIPLFFGGA
jgi:hypothetical protein